MTSTSTPAARSRLSSVLDAQDSRPSRSARRPSGDPFSIHDFYDSHEPKAVVDDETYFNAVIDPLHQDGTQLFETYLEARRERDEQIAATQRRSRLFAYFVPSARALTTLGVLTFAYLAFWKTASPEKHAAFVLIAASLIPIYLVAMWNSVSLRLRDQQAVAGLH